MAKKGKDVRLMITLECTEQKGSGIPGISRYTSEKARLPVDCGCASRVLAPPERLAGSPGRSVLRSAAQGFFGVSLAAGRHAQ
jgi:hypothetical protein